MSGDSLPRLSPEMLDRLPGHIDRPRYDYSAQRCGIVHFGVGAFHRAHQAIYTDDAMNAGDRDWGIVGVSLRSPAVQAQLLPQAGLYSLVQRGAEQDDVRIGGAVRDVLAGSAQADKIVDALASPDTCILSFTVTEKGYRRSLSGSLDLNDEAIIADLDPASVPTTLYGFVRAGLARRRASGLPGLTMVSCDNLAANGAVLEQCLYDFLDASDASLARWFAANCACPSTMVDRIVPATTHADLDRIAKELGAHDAAAVITEPFRQWVIEDRFAAPRPRWEAGGATFVADVHGHELAKLRLLNGAHSALAYLGLHAGYRFVHEAVSDPAIRSIVDRLMQEAGATLASIQGFCVADYCDRLLRRFHNAKLPHSLSQIAMDGSQKLPQRWFLTLSQAGRCGQSCPALLESVAAWLIYIRGDRFDVVDPQAARLKALWAEKGADDIARALFGDGGLFTASWHADPHSLSMIRSILVAAG